VKSLRSKQHKKFVSALKRVRNEAGVTQVQLADKLGVQQSFIAKVEGMERRLDVVEFVNWLEALGESDQAITICRQILTDS